MKIFGFEIKKAAPAATGKKSFHAANSGNLYASWVANNSTADLDIKRDLRTIRNRSRELMRNDDYAKKFKRMVKTNVIGSQGIRLQSKAKDTNGNLDKKANDLIEEKWKRFSKKGICDVTGKYSLIDICNIAMGTVAEDGEILVRKVKGFNNEFGFALQLLEADHLDETFNDPEKNISMGVEYDQWDKPIAYHLFKSHPGNYQNIDRTRERIPADEINHLFKPIRVSATRGVPWMHSAMSRMKMINGYEEAELVGARVAASKGGFYTQKEAEGEYVGDTTIDNMPTNEITPGEFEVLPKGWDFKTYDPQHPNAAFKDFMKVVLRGVSSGLDVAYNSLANDLEGVNFSSLRSGVLEEREVWKDLQKWFCEHFLDDVFGDWLEMALLTQSLPLPYQKFDKFNNSSWMCRKFDWIDPLKDVQANILAVKEGLKTHTQLANEMGMDLEELYEEIAKEQKLRKEYGIVLASDIEVGNIINEKED